MDHFIAYFHSSATAASFQKASGVCRAVHERGWSLLRFDLKSVAGVRSDLTYWQPDGCIVDAVACGKEYFSPKVFCGIPTVFLDCDPRFVRRTTSCVIQDPDATARAAAEVLTGNPLRTYAFASWPGKPFWSESRGKAFKRVLKDMGLDVQMFKPDDCLKNKASVVQELTEWLRSLPRPIGVLTPSDAMSEHVLEAARENGMNVPEDLIVVGIDNDEFFCEHARPSLSSVSLEFEKAGSQAIDVLARLMERPQQHPIREKFAATRFVLRSSTRRSERSDKGITETLDFIREHATDGLSAADVLARFSLSRRLIERRFKSMTGRSIVEEIHAVQIEHAKKLIANPMQKLTAIPQLCGHRSSPFFQRLFVRSVGMTMSEYRESLTQTSAVRRQTSSAD